MTRTLTTTILVLLMLVPSAAAWPWDPFEVRVREPHVGDMFTYENFNDEAVVVESVYHVEGPSTAIDRFGVERATVALRHDFYSGGVLERAWRCHRLADGDALVRRDLLAGWESYSTSTGGLSGVLEGSETTENQSVVSSFDGTCGKRDLFAGRVFREGDRIGIRELFPEETGREALSEPGVATSFAGRDAIAFVFPLATIWEEAGELPPDARFEAVFADGLPGPASYTIMGGDEVQGERLAGFTPGTGGPVPPPGEATLPARNPEATFVPYDPLRFDDAALELPFPYDEAYAALVADVRAGARDWLAAHPDAFLTWATYEPSGAGPSTIGVTGRGSWWLGFREGETVASWIVGAVDSATTPLASYRLPTAYHDVSAGGEFEEDSPLVALPETVLATSDALALATRSGVEEPAPRVTYRLGAYMDGTPYHHLHLTEIDASADERGEAVAIDMDAGGIEVLYAAVFEERATGGLLGGGFAPAPLDASAAPSASPLARPTTIAGAAGAVTAIALLALLVKLVLLPLYTRLRRDRLLDNPVRARLYDRIRAEPGIHLAELEEFLGVGKGATRHHVDQLVAHKLVFVLEVDGYARCYAAGHVPIDVARRVAVLRAGSHARVLELYAARPGLTLREAAKELGMSAPSVHRAKKRLEKEGLLPAASSGPSITLR